MAGWPSIFPTRSSPTPRRFRLYRAVAQIATKADARIVPIVIGGARHLPLSQRGRQGAAAAAAALRIARARADDARPNSPKAPSAAARRAANALFDRLAEARVEAGRCAIRRLFQAMRDAAIEFGPGRADRRGRGQRRADLSRAVAGARILGAALRGIRARPARRSACCCPTPTASPCRCSALLSAGRVAAMINYTAGPANVAAAIRTAIDPHHRLVARLRRESQARRHRRGRRGGRRQIRLAGGPARRHHRNWKSWSPRCCGAGRWPRRARTSRP